MDITIDTGENKIIVHLERFDHKKSFAVMINQNGTTVKMTVDELVKSLRAVSKSDASGNISAPTFPIEKQ